MFALQNGSAPLHRLHCLTEMTSTREADGHQRERTIEYPEAINGELLLELLPELCSVQRVRQSGTPSELGSSGLFGLFSPSSPVLSSVVDVIESAE